MRLNQFSLAFIVLFIVPQVGGARKTAHPTFPLSDSGTEFPINYQKYGEFSGIGGSHYRYKITNKDGLAKAMGSGLFPNKGSSLQKDPAFQKWRAKNSIDSNPWSHVSSEDPQTDFYVWAHTANVGPGTRLFFSAQALEAAGHYQQAVKAYYAVLVHFPKEKCYASDQSFVWYLAEEAINRIESLTKQHPELGYRLRNASFKLKEGENGAGTKEFYINIGYWEKRKNVRAQDLKDLSMIQERGMGKVRLVQYENGHWQLLVNEKPFVVKGVHYIPTPVGQDMSDIKGNSWMFDDENENGKPDAPYDSWIDENKNGVQDDNEPDIGDFEIMRKMGVNAIRLYRLSFKGEYQPAEFNKKLLRDLHATYGISVILGDFLGAYTVGSGADPNEGTDYTDPVQLERMKSLVRDFVNDHKKERYVLMWLLGNENLMKADYSGVNATRTKASRQVEAYLKFVNEVAGMIHQIDPDHPVAVGNLSLTNLEDHARYAPEVDIFGTNSYPGARGFGQLWDRVKQEFDRPVLITEYGCDAYSSQTDQEEENQQADYHRGNWTDIEINLAGGTEVGNAIGGIVFEYIDEWWKSHEGAWDTHDKAKDMAMPFPDGWSSEEWLGIVSQGTDRNSFLIRIPRKTYFLYRDDLWRSR